MCPTITRILCNKIIKLSESQSLQSYGNDNEGKNQDSGRKPNIIVVTADGAVVVDIFFMIFQGNKKLGSFNTLQC